jgi:hypothetical protein
MKFLVTAIVSLSASFAFAQNTLLVSDVDDTVRVMDSGNLQSTISNSLDTKHAFAGMATIYAAIRSQQNKVGFVTGGFSFLKEIYQKFLDRNLFDFDYLVTRRNPLMKVEKYKFKAINKLVEKAQPQALIMIGDNASHDPEVYAAIHEKYANLPAQTYIHQVYANDEGAPLMEGQVGFLTAGDLAVRLYNAGEIHESVVEIVLTQLNLALDSSKSRVREEVIPDWLQCDEFFQTTGWPEIERRTTSGLDAAYASLKPKVEYACAQAH